MRIFNFFFGILLFACSKETNIPSKSETYFPTATEWETITTTELGWDSIAVEELKNFLNRKRTKSFIVLVNGRIAMEEYFNGHTKNSKWEWNSAGKTLIAAISGIAEQENLLSLEDRASDYLGEEWTSLSLEKENQITVKHLLNMTSGTDDTKFLIIKPNITYIADAGTRWAYGNVFQKLTDIVSKASGKPFESYFSEKLKSRIGMDGYWNFGTVFTTYHSTARGMARFGLLALNKGRWLNEQVVNETFFLESITPSQDLNPSYGYFWWLNGKGKYMLPNTQAVFSGSLIPNAPADMYAALGAFDQKIYVVPSKNIVIIRMGTSANPDNPNFAASGFDNELWEKINVVIN